MKNKHNTYDKVDWEIISRYISGEMEEKEKLEFEKRIAEDVDYQTVLASAKNDLTMLDQFQKHEMDFDSKCAWNKLDSKIKNWENHQSKKARTSGFFLRISRIAAVIIALVALGVTAYYFVEAGGSQETIVAGMSEQGKTITLPDGTNVELNAGAEIIYPKRFKGKKRIVNFKGEGFFQVQGNEEKPFVIKTSNARVTVLGTSFNLNTSNNKTEVLVSTGKVRLTDLANNNNKLILEKGDFGSLQNHQLSKLERTDVNYMSWKTQQMIFNETPLTQVLEVIEKTYNVDIMISQDIAENLPLTSTFDREELEIILESISKTFNLTYKKEGRTIVYSRD